MSLIVWICIAVLAGYLLLGTLLAFKIDSDAALFILLWPFVLGSLLVDSVWHEWKTRYRRPKR